MSVNMVLGLIGCVMFGANLSSFVMLDGEFRGIALVGMLAALVPVALWLSTLP